MLFFDEKYAILYQVQILFVNAEREEKDEIIFGNSLL